MAAYPVSAINWRIGRVVVAGINLDWMSKIMNDLCGRPGISAVLVDSAGTVLAAPADQTSMVGRSLDAIPLMSAHRRNGDQFDQANGRFHSPLPTASSAAQFRAHPGTESRLIVSVDEAKVAAGSIATSATPICSSAGLRVRAARRAGRRRKAHHPADRKARGDGEALRQGRLVGARGAQRGCRRNSCRWRARSTRWRPQLGQRERELIASNDRLTVMASIDMLSGLANRRGFQSRLDFEWMKAEQYASELSLLMIDVDHFKLFNDTYGHPEGDACLSRLGETLAGIATETMGFAARYGGEEFSLLLPNTPGRAIEIGEMVRAAVQGLAIPHVTSSHQTVTVSVGVACAKPSDTQRRRSDRSRRRRALCRQTPRPQRRGRTRLCPDRGRRRRSRSRAEASPCADPDCGPLWPIDPQPLLWPSPPSSDRPESHKSPAIP